METVREIVPQVAFLTVATVFVLPVALPLVIQIVRQAVVAEMVIAMRERTVQPALIVPVPLLKSAAPELARTQLAAALPIAMTEALVLSILATMPVLAPLLVPIPLSLLVRMVMAVVRRDVMVPPIMIVALF